MGDIFIGRCRRCKLARRFEAPTLRVIHGDAGYGRKTWQKTRAVILAAPFVSSEAPGEAREFSDRSGKIWLKCPAGHSVEFRKLVGRKNDEPCSAKCLSATGPNCECGCGGENHGRNHDAKAASVVASKMGN